MHTRMTRLILFLFLLILAVPIFAQDLPYPIEPGDQASKEVLILVGEFPGDVATTFDAQTAWIDAINSVIAGLGDGVNARVELLPVDVYETNQALEWGADYGAAVVLWGYMVGNEVTTTATIMTPWYTPDHVDYSWREECFCFDLFGEVPGSRKTTAILTLLAEGTAFNADYERALPLLDRVIQASEFEPQNPNLGYLYTTRGVTRLFLSIEPEQQLADFNQAIALGYQNVWVYQNRGIAYNALGDYEAAIADYTYALEFEPDDSVRIYGNRGLAYLSLEEYRLALDDFNSAIDLNPTDGSLFYNRAIAYQQLNMNLFALADYAQALELGYDEDDVFWGLSTQFAFFGRCEDARIALMRYLWRSWDNSDPAVEAYYHAHCG